MLFGETVAVYCENHTEHREREREIEIRRVDKSEKSWEK
jgi:hypothetical protein